MAAVALVTFGLALAAVMFTREVDRIAAVWPVNAVLTAVLLRSRPSAWPRLLLAGLVGNVAANMWIGDAPWRALMLAGCNSVEVLLCAGVVRRFAPHPVDLGHRHTLLLFLAAGGLLAPTASAVLSAAILSAGQPEAFAADVLHWFAPDALGLVTVTPALLAFTRSDLRDLAARLGSGRGWASLATLVGALAVVFPQERYPLFFLLPSALIFVAFELELAGAALALLVSALLAVVMTLTGHGPAMLIQGGMTARLAVLQIFLATLTITVLPVATALVRRRRLRERLTDTLDQAQRSRSNLLEAQRLSLLAEAIGGIGHWRRDTASGRSEWSRHMYVIHGFDGAHEDHHVRAMALYPPDDQVRIQETVRAASQTGQPFDLKVRLRRANDGAERVVVFKGEAEPGPDGGTVALFGVMRDITDEETATARLAESEARYRLMTTNATDMIACYGFDGRITFLSPSVQAILGYRPDELIGRQASSIMHPDDVAGVTADFQAHIARGGDAVWRFEYRAIRKTGEQVWLEAQPRAIRDPQTGRIIEFHDVVRDITARKAVEAELAASNLRYRVISQNATDVFSRTDRRGVVLQLSPSIMDVAGYAPEEIIGRNWTAFLHPDDIEPTLAIYHDIILGQHEAQPIAYRARHKDGRWIWLEGNPTPLRDETGRVLEFIDVTRDVSARMRLEAELRAARDAAQAAAAVKSDFMANMSHEIRTPLTAILGFTKLLSDDNGLDELGRERLERVSRASEALLAIVNDVLDFSKLEAGQFDIAPEPVDPTQILNQAAAMFAPQAQAKGLALTVEIDPSVPPCVSVDPHRLLQILNNLIGNAIKFTEKGRVTLSVGHRKGRLRVEVSDTGPGLGKAQRQKLFQRFSQVDASSTRRHGGTGLGLAICKGLVEAMGGEIGVKSLPGRGSTFSFQIEAPAAAFRTVVGSEGVNQALEGARVLVADDNSVNRELARAILTPLGVEVTDAGDGAAALLAAEAAPFDIILLDVRMPGLTGPQTAARIRAGTGPNRDVPILAFTADVEKLDPSGEGADFDGIILKPIAPLQLVTALGAHVAWNAQDGEGADVVAV